MNNTMELNQRKIENTLITLRKRFEENTFRHKSISWTDVEKKIIKSDRIIKSIYNMEATGGEPDVIDFNPITNTYSIVDCSKESPLNRRSLLYDYMAQISSVRTKNTNAMDESLKYGAQLLTEKEYLLLQSIESLDNKSSSWIKTPEYIRNSGAALYGQSSFGRVFIHFNPAKTSYTSRGFRTILKV
ncbi:DUF4256 domain-containing protein [Brumimicrobium oceani]|uniref:DUF4256 domain-containing protein n=1 Tax=Brumimicrobium oceani TaxID=2100725 RepID=A0A2U2XG98_9FLAO|nr:DUF4256 domain-containing protein [Brumimicrobium oceani]PWH86814.1 DUF4256 domain-containing protein [Brumimicrobium oceani]